VALAEKIIAADDEIDDKEKDIEHTCLRLLMLQQPVARDLRLVSSILKIVTDLERIGDHATDISEITLLLVKGNYRTLVEHIPQMASVTMKMTTESIDAFVRKDLVLANKVIADDDIVDNLFDMAKEDVIKLIQQDTKNGDQAIDQLMIAKYFERIGDHATNVAEWVVFSLTGKHKSSQIM
jgi:phosphate transport system protein